MLKNKKSPACDGAMRNAQSHNDVSSENLQGVLALAGLPTSNPIIADGKLHRFHVAGDTPKSLNGWYVFYSGDVAAGAFGCWKRGISKTWCSKSKNDMTYAERQKYVYKIKKAQKAHEDEKLLCQSAAAIKARAIWNASSPAPDTHPYLVKKGVKSHGIRQYKGNLVIPLRDGAGVLHSLQFIDKQGRKKFLSGGRTKGCYFSMGIPAETLCVAEGYATASSIYESTGYAVAVVFSCNNIKAVAEALRDKFPSTKFVICADNDTKTKGNPGLTCAREAAAAINGFVAVPPCHGDFNDFVKGE